MAKRLIMKIDILNTKYKVFVDTPDHDERLKTCDGYIAPELKYIVLDRNNKDIHMKHVITHEIVHGMLYESGLDVETWANNEEIVDWIALQLCKLNSIASDAINKLKPFYKKPKEEKQNGEKEKHNVNNRSE